MLELAKKDCNGCGACFNACPVRCISMKADENGFLYPEIDTTKCIECGACEMACPPLTPLMSLSGEPKVEAAFYQHDGFRPHASTGSIFSLVTNYVLAQEGVAFGAGFDSKMFLRHRSTNDERDSFSLVGAKPIQSNTLETMREARDFLQAGKLVFYTGTPCQVEGFLAFLGRTYDNLITADFVCPGMMSPKVLVSYDEGLQKDYGGTLRSFRVKYKIGEHGNCHVKTILKPEQKFYMPEEKNEVMKLYNKGYGLRPACYSCKFRKTRHLADFTLGDLLGEKKPVIYNPEGISLVQINTEQGEKIWHELDQITREGIKMLIHEPWDLAEERRINAAMTQDMIEPENNGEFFAELGNLRFRKLAGKYCDKEKKGFLARFFNV